MNAFESSLAHHQNAILEATTRRHFLRDCTTGLGGIWLGAQSASAAINHGAAEPLSSLPAPHEGKVKRVIHLQASWNFSITSQSWCATTGKIVLKSFSKANGSRSFVGCLKC
jgi:hypothetical protein